MVCPRCIETVKTVFEELNIQTQSVSLGEVITIVDVKQSVVDEINKKLITKGFEVLENNESKLINKVKALIIQQIHHSNQSLNTNFSTFLSDQLHYEYSSLSRLFSSVEGITIEKFILKQKIERVKELVFYDELTLSEIAFQMNYSSVAHLSAQFKKETGMTPSEFKKLKKPGHTSLDSL